jgi:hypothetical protein
MISMTKGQLTISDSLFNDCYSVGQNGLLYLGELGESVISNTRFEKSGITGGAGGAMYIDQCSKLTIINCTFKDIQALSFGCAISIRHSIVSIINPWIEMVSCIDMKTGEIGNGGIYAHGSFLTISGNMCAIEYLLIILIGRLLVVG